MITVIVQLITGMILFLYGMSVMSDALERAAGNKLELMLSKLTSSSVKSVALGTGVTAVIQSSSATSIMAVGFVNSGVMKLRQAIGIILGAILGTSITGWIVALSEVGGDSGWLALFSTDTITCVFALIGIILHSFSKKHNTVADILLGFTVLMVGIGTMSGAVEPLQDNPAFIEMLTKFSNPFLGILVGALCTAVLQSASAAVGILQALSLCGAINFATAFPLLLGIPIGASLPVLFSALGAKTEGKRSAMSYLIFSVLGAVICGGIFYGLNAVFDFTLMTTTLGPASIALVNTVFRFAFVIIFLPFLGGIEKLACLLVKDKEPAEESDIPRLVELDERLIPYPALALEQCQRAINDMANASRESVILCFKGLTAFDEEQLNKVEQLEQLTDQYEDKIGTYLMEVSRNELNEEENAGVFKYLHTLSDIELITDYAKDISLHFRNNHETGDTYPEAAVSEMTVIQNALQEMVDTMVTLFTGMDKAAAGRIAVLVVVIQSLCNKAELKQVTRIQSGACNMEQGASVNQVLTDYSHIATHCSKIALAMMGINADNIRQHISDHDFDINSSHARDEMEVYRQKYSLEPAEVTAGGEAAEE